MTRLRYLAVAPVVIALGLGSRRPEFDWPAWYAVSAGDVLWAMLVYLVVRAVRPGAARGTSIGLALSIAYAVELSQLYRVGWLDAIRATRPGALLLGSDFVRADLARYTLGVALGALGDMAATRIPKRVTNVALDLGPGSCRN